LTISPARLGACWIALLPPQSSTIVRELEHGDLAAGADVGDDPAVAVAERRDDRAHDVANVHEVTGPPAIAEDRERETGARAIGDDRDHVRVRARRALARTVHVELNLAALFSHR